MNWNFWKQLLGGKAGQKIEDAVSKAAPIVTPILAQVLISGGGKPDLSGVVALANTGLAVLAQEHPDPLAQVLAAEAQQYLTLKVLGGGAPVQVLQLPATLPAPRPLTPAPPGG